MTRKPHHLAISRRSLLQHAAFGTALLGVGAPLAGCAGPAAAPPAAAPAAAPGRAAGETGQYSQAEAAYQDRPNNGERCAGCRHFIQPNACQIVTGQISPDGWCQFYNPAGAPGPAPAPGDGSGNGTGGY